MPALVLRSALALLFILTIGSCAPSRLVPSGPPPENWAVLVPGLWDDSSRYNQLRPLLEERGWRVLDFPLVPNNGSVSNRQLASQLGARIENTIPRRDQVALIGFSMGGLVARSYVQEMNGHRRVDRLLTIGSPNQGTETARLLNREGIREMVPGSPFLDSLNRRHFSTLREIPYGNIWTSSDGVILPAGNARIPGG
ncbi:MAG: alpha/beta fold hydrolase, partial [Verrucomicrobiota bacterium]